MSNLQIFAANDEERWSLVQQRDRSVEGLFLYAVKTTGVYCRPGCSSRLPRRENVLFFDDVGQARAAGFRPCKRCRPDAEESGLNQADAVKMACQLIDDAEEPMTLEQLSSAVDYSPSHFHKLFKQAVGVTPKAYTKMRRANRVREKLLENGSVTRAVFSAGYGASSRFYDEADSVLGMTPGEYRNGAEGIVIHVAVATTSLGLMLVAATDKGLCAIEFGDDEKDLLQNIRKRFPRAEFDQSEEFTGWVAGVVTYVDEPGARLSLPLDIQGTAFQRRVWDALCKIPVGTTTTYSEIADQIGQSKGARAVANACAANRLAMVIPCHRVVRNDGKMGGYRWGIERKVVLLERESKEASAPTKK